MAEQVYGSPFQPLGSAQFIGADAVVSLISSAPSNSGGFGKTITQIETTLNTNNKGGDPIKYVGSIVFGVEGGAIHVLTTGQAPTAAIGVPYAAGVYERENDALWIRGCKAFVPTGVTLNVEYGQ